jgi:hypothetical protein
MHTAFKRAMTAAQAAGTAYQVGKMLWGVGRALAPLLI